MCGEKPRVVYYYLRDEARKPWITVCLLVDSAKKVLARGVAICSLRDNPHKRKGRAIALSRAMKAHYDRRRFGYAPIITDRVNDVFETVHAEPEEYRYKSIHNPHITHQEFEMGFKGDY
jgi:hypothetical protein